MKEPSFYCSYYQFVTNPVTYHSLFENAFTWRIDSSHVYLTNPESAELLALLYPASRFIVILRDPVERAHALYRHMRRYNHPDGQPYEQVDDFLEALLIEDERFHSNAFWTNCRQYPWNFFYRRSGHFHEQVERYFEHFPRESFLFLTLSDLASDPLRTLSRVAEFLEICFGPFSELSDFRFNMDTNRSGMEKQARDYLQVHLGPVWGQVETLIGHRLNRGIGNVVPD